MARFILVCGQQGLEKQLIYYRLALGLAVSTGATLHILSDMPEMLLHRL